MSRNRPYASSGVQALERLADTDDVTQLTAVRDELLHRKTDRARRLRARVDARISKVRKQRLAGTTSQASDTTDTNQEGQASVSEQQSEEQAQKRGSGGAPSVIPRVEEGLSSEAARSAIEKLRMSLLDISNKNSLVRMRHSDKSKTHVRVIDELPDELLSRLENDRKLTFKALPPPPDVPEDEKTDAFLMALEEARQTDPTYREAVAKLDDDRLESKKGQEIERRLKDRVREQLGLGPRPHTDVMSIGEYARTRGFEPSYDLPEPDPTGNPAHHEDDEIQTLMLPEAMQRSLSGVLEQAKSALREMGTNTLYVALGFLEWYESSDSSTKLHAPLLLHPVEITKELVAGEYRFSIQSTGEETEVNLTISERLARDFDLRLPEYEEGDTPESYFAKVEEHFGPKQPRWRVRRFVTVGHFSFSRLVMFRDLDPANWPEGQEMHTHAGVAALLGGTNVEGGTSAEPYAIDDPQIAKKIPMLIADADSSQMSAIVDVMDGQNLAIEGPPGTGKSQTITNIIGAAMAQGKRVLFIAEKMAALQVVKSRLDAAGLGEFALEMHSTKARKQDVLQGLSDRLEVQGRERAPERLEEARETLWQLKEQLTNYVDLLNKRYGKLGMTIQEILWAEQRTRDEADLPDGLGDARIQDAEEVTAYAMDEAKGHLRVIEDHVADFVQAYGALQAHPWYGVDKPDISPFERDSLIRAFAEWRKAAEALDELLETMGGRPTSRGDVQRLIAARDAYPETPELPDVLAQLADPADVDRLSALLDALDRWDSARVSLRENCRDPEALADQQEELAHVGQEARRLDLEDKALGALPDLIEQERMAAHRWRELVDLADQLIGAVGLEGTATVRRIAPLVRAGRILNETDRRLLLLRTSHLVDEGAAEDLARGRRKRDELLGRKQEIERFVRVPVTRDGAAAEMRRHAAPLKKTGLFAGLASDVRAAKRYYRELGQERRTPNRGQMASRLQDAARLLEDIDTFASDQILKEICGSRFEGLETDFDALQGVNAFASRVGRDLGGMDAETRTVRKLLLRGDIEDLDTLIGFARDPRFSELAQALDGIGASGETPLADLADRLDARASEIEALKERADRLRLSENAQIEAIPSMLEATETLSEARDAVARSTDAHALLAAAGEQERCAPSAERGALRVAVEAARTLHATDLPEQTRAHLFAPDYAERRDRLIEQTDQAAERLHGYDSAWTEAATAGDLDSAAFLQGAPDDVPASEVAKRIARAEDNPGTLQGWATYVSARHSVYRAGLGDLLEAYDAAGARYANLEVAYERVLYRSLAHGAYSRHPELNRFSGLSQEEARRRFKQTDKEIIQLERQALRAQLSQAQIPRGNAEGKVKDKTELGLIKSMLQVKKPRTPLRDLLDRSGRAIQQMKPCFMMSPLSVAQYLKPGQCEFDLVVIDEASQMKPEDAIGGLIRAGQIVVVGDPKQLPPTSFFDRIGADNNDDEDEDTEAANVESILGMAMHCWHPYRRLLWHYRSRHGSLIAFSNEKFYDRELIVFPAPIKDNPEYGVRLERVEGRCRRGGTNTIEAQQVAEAAVEFMRREAQKPEEAMRSLGVVAMNRSQTELILDEINRLLQRTPEAYGYTEAMDSRAGGLESFFVKNLENVQGDERDVIFISVTYGPDPDSGVVKQHFGPINTDLGWRRLNVLFTRAKQQIRVFSSMTAADVKVSDPNVKRGRRALHDYLEYAAHGRLHGGSASGAAPDNDFERFVKNRLEARGFDVDCQVGVAGYFLDLAVSHPAFPDGYICGVECDGATYHSAHSARDRDRLRQEVLENLGWNIFRVWSTDWFADPDTETDRMERHLRELLRQQAPVTTQDADANVVGLFRDQQARQGGSQW